MFWNYFQQRRLGIGISVFSTGHEFNDRGGGPEKNTLLVHGKQFLNLLKYF